MLWTASGGACDAPSGGGKGKSSLPSSNEGGGRSGSDSANNTVRYGKESTPTSPSSQDGGKGTGGGREGESTPPSPAPSYSTPTSDSGEGAPPVLLLRDRGNME